MDLHTFGTNLMMSCLDREAEAFVRKYFAHVPELAACAEVAGGDQHAENVLEHLIGALGAASGYHPVLQLAALFHDIGKPAVVATKDKKQIFHNHEVVGAQMIKSMFPKFGYNEVITRDVSHLVRHHMYYFNSEAKDKAFRRWLLQVGPNWFDLLLLRMADRRGNLAKNDRAAFTSQMNGLIRRVHKTIEDNPVVFATDLNISEEEIQEPASKSQIKEITSALVGLTNSEPEKNTNSWLKEYVTRVYGASESNSSVSTLPEAEHEGS